MIITDLIMLGDSSSGKSRLIQRIAPDVYPINRELENGASIPAYTFHVARNNRGPRYNFLCTDTACRSDSVWVKASIKGQTLNKDYILYCVDLSKPMDMGKLNDLFKDIQSATSASWFKAKSQSIILVGTKSDISNPDYVAAFNSYEFDAACHVAPTRYMTSAIEGTGIEQLKDGLFDQVRNKHWNNAVTELKATLQRRGLSDLTVIDSNLQALKDGLDNGAADFSTFVNNAHDHLKDALPACKVPPVMETITTFAYHLLWTVFAATLVGFTVGFMMGVWSGPGAFVTGVLGASVAAQKTLLAAGIIGAIKGGYETQRLFRPVRSAKEDIHNFVFDIEHPTVTVCDKAYDYMSRCGV